MPPSIADTPADTAGAAPASSIPIAAACALPAKISGPDSHYPPGPLVRAGRDGGAPRAGQRMPDIQVRAGDRVTTLHCVLRGGRHVPVAPTAHAASVLSDPTLRRYRSDLEIVTPASALGDHRATPFVLIRPDGHIAARGRPGSMDAITGYLRELFGEPACDPDEHLDGGAPHRARGMASRQRSS